MKNLRKHGGLRRVVLGRNRLAAVVIAFVCTIAQGQESAVNRSAGAGASQQQERAQAGGVHESGIGAKLQDVNAPIASSFGLNRVAGALVASVIEGSPAYEAGLQVGDIVLSLDDVAVRDTRHLLQLLDAHASGSFVRAEVWRDSYPIPLKIQVPAARGAVASMERTMPVSDRVAGLVVRELSHADLCREGVHGVKGGLLVVSTEGAAAAAGIRAGALILGVNASALTRIEDFYAQFADREGRELAMLVRQNGQERFIPLAVPRR